MKRIIALSLWAGATALAIASPALGQKPGGPSSAEDVGGNLAELISDNLGPMLIVLIGAVGIGALMARSIGQMVMVVVGGLFIGFFLLEPSAGESLFNSIYDIVF